jgi:hypothetical protein
MESHQNSERRKRPFRERQCALLDLNGPSQVDLFSNRQSLAETIGPLRRKAEARRHHLSAM